MYHPSLYSLINNPCRGSSIGRACGSYNSKEINLKVVGSSPTFGYSYIKVPRGSCSFDFWLVVCRGVLVHHVMLALLLQTSRQCSRSL
jgi:hypothetical protein